MNKKEEQYIKAINYLSKFLPEGMEDTAKILLEEIEDESGDEKCVECNGTGLDPNCHDDEQVHCMCNECDGNRTTIKSSRGLNGKTLNKKLRIFKALTDNKNFEIVKGEIYTLEELEEKDREFGVVSGLTTYSSIYAYFPKYFKELSIIWGDDEQNI